MFVGSWRGKVRLTSRDLALKVNGAFFHMGPTSDVDEDVLSERG